MGSRLFLTIIQVFHCRHATAATPPELRAPLWIPHHLPDSIHLRPPRPPPLHPLTSAIGSRLSPRTAEPGRYLTP